ncbi:MAG: prolyl oligopeptidase family serine peptidase [Gemmatimonadales bacterium]|nr:prolyl oligopeptidase family serine peptidase [Gemmatimonadales bacterium]
MRLSSPSSKTFPILGLALILALVSLPEELVAIATEDNPEAPVIEPVPVTEVLTAGPVTLALPAFHSQEKGGVEADDLFQALPGLPQKQWPQSGDRFSNLGGALSWKAADAPLLFSQPANDKVSGAVHYTAFYVTSDRWQKATLTITTEHAIAATLDGSALKIEQQEGQEGAATSHTGELVLPIGKHLICLRTMYSADKESDKPAGPSADWSLGMSITPDSDAGPKSLSFSVVPEHRVDIQLILDAPRIAGVDLSPDGKLVAVSLGEFRSGNEHESWVEIRDTKDGSLLHLWRGQDNPSRVTWCPKGQKLSWQTGKDGRTTLWLYDLAEGTSQPVLEDVENLGSWRWALDGASLFYEITRSPDEDPRGVKLVAHPADRQPWWRGRSHLMQVLLPDGLTRQLTAGPLSPNGWQISPDGKKMLFFTNEPDLQNRPYTSSKLWLMDLETLAAKEILNDSWIDGAVFGPEKGILLLRGSPSAFDGLGRNLPDGMQANDYGGQLYLYDLAGNTATPITKDLKPAVGWVEWSLADGLIYARTTDTQHSNIYRCDPKQKKWQKVETGMEFTRQVDLPRQGRVAVAYGTSANTPNRLYALDLKKNQYRMILDPGAEDYRDVVLGKVESWKTTLPGGMELDGFVYFPPAFDPSRKYPLIVYYYGGTSPVTRDFGGRYPKNIWAGQDYIVYVPEPSGATGYGQEFAARHVNDWGILTAGEVIEGTKAFLKAHDFADPERVGCIGASYGGFLTEYVITRTDIFAAAVSHAGISDISSYWGEGLWGYAYGARALANSFPWQDRELFIEQSPLFHADKINTPLLLVHGDSDVNVPKGESDQLFTALKMLGREVDYVQIVGQDHHILDHDKRIVWNDTILAFFAKHLKEQPNWWNEMYPEPEDY